MSSVTKRRPVDVLRGFFQLGHPGPSLLYVFAVAIFALFAAWPQINWNIFILLIVAHLAMQFAIGVTNDYCDRHRDVLSKKNKPIVHGLVLPREALFAAFLLMLIMVLLLIAVNPLVLLVALLYLACMQSYNLGLKGTPLSGLVFALGTPLIPIYAYVGVGRSVPFIWWQIPVSALLGVAFNLANSLPDIQEDTATEAHTLAVRLGLKGSLAVCSLLVLLAAIVIGVLAITGLVPPHQPWLLLLTLVFVLLAVGVLYMVFCRKEAHQTLKIYFYVFTLLCLVLGAGWIVSVLF
jgi:4-hydroxybenzoate polyprenyltransferase